jgi:hypothetical protein
VDRTSGYDLTAEEVCRQQRIRWCDFGAGSWTLVPLYRDHCELEESCSDDTNSAVKSRRFAASAHC